MCGNDSAKKTATGTEPLAVYLIYQSLLCFLLFLSFFAIDKEVETSPLMCKQ